MNLKYNITLYVINKLNLTSTSKNNTKFWNCIIWKNIRNTQNKGMLLTEKGFQLLCAAEIHFYQIQFESVGSINATNKFTLWLDHNFEYPWYLTNKRIYFCNKKPAVELSLFSGDLEKYFHAHNKFQHQLST